MQIGDIYKSKKGNHFIQIEGYAHHLNKIPGFIIVYNNLEEIDNFLAASPSFMGYALDENQILSHYKLYLESKEINPYTMDKISKKILKEMRENNYEN